MSIPEQFAKILKQMDENKSYGSVEIFFEDGKITQITQRVITKINSKKPKEMPKQKFTKPIPKPERTNVSLDETIIDLVV